MCVSLLLFVCVCVCVGARFCVHSPCLYGIPGVLSRAEQETILVSERGERTSESERKRERGGESWRREVNEKFIRLQVPKALLSLPGVLSFKLLGRGGGTVPKRW